MMAAFRSYLNSQAFTEIQTPKLVASATESGANVFGVDYFGQNRVSGAKSAIFTSRLWWASLNASMK